MGLTIRDGIYDLTSSVMVDTKELGRAHIDPWPSQRIVIDGICSGLADGVHEFVVLKSRQMAITTIADIIALFWALSNPGTQAAIIADRTDNLERLRRIFAALVETLPREWRGPGHRLLQNNRQGLTFANNSVIDLMAAANNPDLGASRAINFLHATECSLWRNLSGVESLKASLARQNPHRLYIWESIANGLNWYYKYWQRAKKDPHMRAIFVGFWANPTYTIDKGDDDYKIYWDGGHLTNEEIKRARYVKEHYGVTLKPGQIAWWRRELEFSAEEHMLRHYPWTEDECFIASGSGFFPARRTMEIQEALGDDGLPYRGYHYNFAEDFLGSSIEQTTDPDKVHLKVWEPPVDGAMYVIGCDPSGGGGGESDENAIEVFRCYSDRLVQVAEFATNHPLTHQCAWVLAHLCGAYSNHTVNFEVTGIGAAIPVEVRNLRLMAERNMLVGNPERGPLLDMIGQVRWYLYKRADTYNISNSIAWKTNFDNKGTIYTEFRDSVMLRRLEIRSQRLLAQMQGIVTDQGTIGAGADQDENDDLVTASVLAHHVWCERLLPGLISQGLTWSSQHEKPPRDPNVMLSFAFTQHMQQVNRNANRRKETF